MVTQKVGERVLHPEVTKQLFSHRGGRSFLITHFTAKYFPDRVIYLNFYFPVHFTPFQDMFDFHTGTSMTITPDGIRNQEMSLTADQRVLGIGINLDFRYTYYIYCLDH